MILMTGGNGLLGKEIQKLEKVAAPSKKEMNILSIDYIYDAVRKYKPTTILHLAAKTDPLSHETNPAEGIEANIIGTANVAIVCAKMGLRMVYTSTDYVYVGPGPHKEDEPVLPPYNFGWSKLGGECSVRMVPNHLILRLSFGPRPYPWDRVYNGQVNSKLYVDEIAPLVLSATKSEFNGVMNLGGEQTTLWRYAQRTVADIESMPKPDWVPFDTSLDLTKMKQCLNSGKN